MGTLLMMYEKIAGVLRSEEGQTVIEYILVIVLVALVLVFAFVAGGVEEGVKTAATNIKTQITNTP